MHIIKCYATDTDYNISSDYDDLSQAFCFEQHMLGWKHFLQGEIIPYWMDIINNEREQLGLPPNIRAVPQMMTALITTTLNLCWNQCLFMHGGSHSEKNVKQRRILLKQVENLKTRGQTSAGRAYIICKGPPPQMHNFGSYGQGFGQHRHCFGRLTHDMSVFRRIA